MTEQSTTGTVEALFCPILAFSMLLNVMATPKVIGILVDNYVKLTEVGIRWRMNMSTLTLTEP